MTTPDPFQSALPGPRGAAAHQRLDALAPHAEQLAQTAFDDGETPELWAALADAVALDPQSPVTGMLKAAAVGAVCDAVWESRVVGSYFTFMSGAFDEFPQRSPWLHEGRRGSKTLHVADLRPSHPSPNPDSDDVYAMCGADIEQTGQMRSAWAKRPGDRCLACKEAARQARVLPLLHETSEFRPTEWQPGLEAAIAVEVVRGREAAFAAADRAGRAVLADTVATRISADPLPVVFAHADRGVYHRLAAFEPDVLLSRLQAWPWKQWAADVPDPDGPLSVTAADIREEFAPRVRAAAEELAPPAASAKRSRLGLRLR